jgi:predicted regulator of Ras-like GTPase activity (Roadblock/LC7/MglB family)
MISKFIIMGNMSEIYSNILTGLKKINGVKMTALGSRDGFLISKTDSDEAETMTRMAAAMIRGAETAANKLGKVNLNRMIVEFNDIKLIAASAGPKAVISVMATQDASLDPIISELDRTVERIRDII